MTKRLISLKSALLAGLVLSMVAVSTAGATHLFDDVPDDKFFAVAVEWAATNMITTGTSPTTFDPLRDATRGESVTFLKRYDDNIVQPALSTLTTNAAALDDLIGLFAFDEDYVATSTSSATPVDLGLLATVTIPTGHTGLIWAQFSAESACHSGDGVGDWCEVEILIDGVTIDASDQAFDSTNGTEETFRSWESHALTRVTDGLPAGTYAITATANTADGTPTFGLDYMILTAEVKLTS